MMVDDVCLYCYSLLRALMSDKKQTQGTEAEIPTDGIDIIPWTVKSEDGHEVTFSTWDFAGQAVYYNTHQVYIKYMDLNIFNSDSIHLLFYITALFKIFINIDSVFRHLVV